MHLQNAIGQVLVVHTKAVQTLRLQLSMLPCGKHLMS